MLGILIALGYGGSAAIVLAVACLRNMFLRKWKDIFLLLAFSAAGWVRGFCAAEVPLPKYVNGNRRQIAIRIDRCTVHTYASGRRIRGFAHIEEMENCHGKLGQCIYYNLALGEGLPIPQRGQLLRVRAIIHSTRNSKASFERYLREVGILSRIGSGTVTAVEPGSAADEFFAKVLARCTMSLQLAMDGSGQAGRIYEAMLLGNRNGLSAKEKDTYSRAGVAHLFAISGLHIGIIASFLAFATRWLGVSSWPLFAIRLLLLSAFVAMTGASPSSVRALIMVTSFWAAPLFSRYSSSMPSLTAAAFITLLARPLDLLNTGFQLSYAVVFSLIAYGIPLGRRIQQLLVPRRKSFSRENKRPNKFRATAASCIDMAAISFSTTIPLIPLSLYHFQTFSIGGIFINPLVIPVAEIAILCGFCSLCCGLFGIFACCQLFNFFARPFLWAIVFLTSSTGAIPWVQSGELAVSASVLIPWTAVTLFAIYCARSEGKGQWKFIAPIVAAVFPLSLLPLIS
jgi:competence protein ComEC